MNRLLYIDQSIVDLFYFVFTMFLIIIIGGVFLNTIADFLNKVFRVGQNKNRYDNIK